MFDRARTTITEHIQNIYSSGELDKDSTCRKFRHMGENGQEYFPKYYNLDMIISVGYRVDSIRATQFRQWATRVLKEFSTKGYVLDKEHMGLSTWKNAPRGKIVRADVSVAKNYLSDAEMKNMNQLVSMYLDYASRQASKHIPMTMQDWAGKLDFFLTMNDEKLLVGKGSVSHEEAKLYAESEFEKYRLIQDALFKSDFDLFAIAMDQGIEDRTFDKELMHINDPLHGN